MYHQPGQHPDEIESLNVPVHTVTMEQTIDLARQFMDQPGCTQIATVNPEFVMTAQEDAQFTAVLREADLCIPDGIGLVVASRWIGRPLPERVPGSELVYRLAEAAAEHGWRLFLLGAAPGVADEAADLLQARYPALTISGTYAGSPDMAENEQIVSLINDSEADMLFVAYGAPNQDKWINRNREKLTSIRLAMGVGGSLDFVTGRAQRAPNWVQSIGMECLHRLLKEPWRWRRMLVLPQFAVKVLLDPRVAK